MSRPKEVFNQSDDDLALLDAPDPEIGHNHPPCVGCREMSEQMEWLGDEIGHAREEKRLAEALAEEVNDKYNRLRRALSALVMQ